jgi:hypothetical protein
MLLMKTATNAMLCWTPGTSHVRLVPWPDHMRLSDAYECTDLACSAVVHETSPDLRRAYVLVTALQLITQDGCPRWAVHNALLPLEEYSQSLAPDVRHLLPEPADELAWLLRDA